MKMPLFSLNCNNKITDISSFFTDIAHQENIKMITTEVFVDTENSQIFINNNNSLPFDKFLKLALANKNIVINIEIISKNNNILEQQIFVDKLICVINCFQDIAARILFSSLSLDILEYIKEKNRFYNLSLKVLFNSWEYDFEEFKSSTHRKYLNLGCMALIVNEKILNNNRVAQLKDLCGKIAVYGDNFCSIENISELLKYDIDSYFTNDADMANTNSKPTKIGFLATGDEITIGDIVNTNSATLAVDLYKNKYTVGQHLSCKDKIYDIYQSLEYLFLHHDIVFTIGGLGPTEDDITCQAIAKFADKPMFFNDESWQKIKKIILKKHTIVPESNRKQAYFPVGATILQNNNGTADGCFIEVKEKKYLFMLPGPPNECIAMFNHEARPILETIAFKTNRYSAYWQLIEIGESQASEMLEPIKNKYEVNFGYRVFYPYMELKLHSDNPDVYELEHCVAEINEIFSKNIVSNNQKIGSELLADQIATNKCFIDIKSDALKGYLIYNFSVAQSCQKKESAKNIINLSLTGLEDYWNSDKNLKGSFACKILINNILNKTSKSYAFEKEIYFYGEKTSKFIYEYICFKILKILKEEG